MVFFNLINVFHCTLAALVVVILLYFSRHFFAALEPPENLFYFSVVLEHCPVKLVRLVYD